MLHVLSDAVERGTTFLWHAVKSSSLGKQKQKQNQPLPPKKATHQLPVASLYTEALGPTAPGVENRNMDMKTLLFVLEVFFETKSC